MYEDFMGGDDSSQGIGNYFAQMSMSDSSDDSDDWDSDEDSDDWDDSADDEDSSDSSYDEDNSTEQSGQWEYNSDEIADFFEYYDKDGDNKLSYAEFEEMYVDFMGGDDSDQEEGNNLAQMNSSDSSDDSDDYDSEDDSSGFSEDDEDDSDGISNLFEDYDVNGDGELDLEEFADLFEDLMEGSNSDGDGDDSWNNFAQTQINAQH